VAINLERMTPGRRLRVLRVAAGLKVWELAARAGVPQGRISELENDRRAGTPREWERLHTALAEIGDGPGAA
jgi:transcriptional regulator with XRE-family HTH domain